MAERLSEGEQAVLSALEDKTRRTSAQQRQQQPTVYAAVGESGTAFPPALTASRKRAPSLARLVRKVMMEQKNVVAPTATAPGHTRTRSNVQVYNLLEKLKDEPEESLDDVFQEDVFYPESAGVSPPQVAADAIPEDETPVSDGGTTIATSVVDIEQTPVVANATTPLLAPSNAISVQRLKTRRQKVSLCNASTILSFFRELFAHCWLMIFSAMLAGAALVLYYELGNPKIDALGKTGLSWYCNFFARQLVLLECARVIKFLVLDCILLGPHSVRHVGPFFTLLALQAKDWPFIVTVWGMLDCCLLQGNNAFQNHWLYHTGWSVYSMDAASGLTLLSSESYLRFLVCMIVAGIATLIKRTAMAISFGQRQYSTFKPRLEKILLDVVLLNEVASLSTHASLMHAELNPEDEKTNRKNRKRTGLQDVTWKSVRMEGSMDESSDQDETQDANEELTGSSTFHRSSSSGPFLKSLLDRWEEPVTATKGDATIEDVLRFRRALAFMDEVYPFGEDFGVASTRDEAIASAEKVYHELCKIATHKGSLPFAALAMIAIEDGDTYDQTKRGALRRLFHPDKDDVLTLLAFVQSCDAIFRRLRYFLATVKNSVSLDKVLENVLNSLYYFVLALFLLALMNYNAWGLLVSMTSLLVSFSFAFGQTVSKYVQGIILIAVTRPFDLGDRVFLTPAGDVERGLENAGNGFFVEDITLSSTKLRFARTGEVAYIANNLLADMRIYNCNRSPNASVVIQPVLHICALEKDNMKKFEDTLRTFVDERPRQWAALLVSCVVNIDSDNEKVHLMIAFRHRDSWQNTARIYKQRGELMEYVHNVTKQLGIAFESPPPRRVIYMGGQLEQGAVSSDTELDHRTDLLRPKNIRSTSVSHERSVSDPTLTVNLSPLDIIENR